MLSMRKIAVALSVLALAAAGCGDDDDQDQEGSVPAPAAPDGGGSTVSVAADPGGALAYEPATLTANAGQVTIDFANRSELPQGVGGVVHITDTVADPRGRSGGPGHRCGSRRRALSTVGLRSGGRPGRAADVPDQHGGGQGAESDGGRGDEQRGK